MMNGDGKISESKMQATIIRWTDTAQLKYPELALLFHIPNERRCTPIQGAQLKRMGVKSGVPDLCLPVARGAYHGLWIEVKTPKGRVSDNQKWWLCQLERNGYCVYVCRSAAEAICRIEEYLRYTY